MTDFKLLEDLCRARGISGQEAAVRELIMDQVKPYADQITLDNLGNLLVFKQGAERPKTKLMLSAIWMRLALLSPMLQRMAF